MAERIDRCRIVAALREIAGRLRLAGDNPFRARAYAAGAEAIEGLSDADLERRLEDRTLTEIEGIGAALAATIGELARRGHVDLLDRLRAAGPAALLELTKIPGVTTRRARLLHDALGIANIDELQEAARAGRVQTVKGFGAKTEATLLAAIAEYRRRPVAMRLVDAREVAGALARFASGCPGIEAVDVAGAVRRWEEVVDEVAIVGVTTRPLPAVLDAVATYPPLARIEERTEDRLSARLATGARARVRLASPATRGRALIEETGPPVHVARLRDRAAAAQLDWETLEAPDEEAVYSRLGLPAIPAEARAWNGLPGPDDLVELVSERDLVGGVHCHTTYSDGRHSIEQMARAADARGLQYLTITDHSPTASYAGGVDLDRLREQWDEIARVQEMVEVRLLRGTESDILADGSLDYPDAVLERLDVIIASIHRRDRMDGPAMTARLVRAMKLPVFKIWGHALGRLILRREPIACDVDAVLDAVATSRAAIEISGDPYRLDLPPAWIPAARRRGIRFVISTDAHAVADLDHVIYGVAMARRAGVKKAEVLNTLSCSAFSQLVHP